MTSNTRPLRRRDDHLVIASLQATAAFLEEQLRLVHALKVRDADYLARVERTISNVRKDLADRMERVEVVGHGGTPRVVAATAGEPEPDPKRAVLSLLEGGDS